MENEGGYQPDFELRPGEEGFIEDPNKAHEMANARHSNEMSAQKIVKRAQAAKENGQAYLHEGLRAEADRFRALGIQRAEEAGQKYDEQQIKSLN